MRVYNNEISVHRNETFTFDKLIVARDDAPYVVSSSWDNPYILLTISSARYEQENRYLANWWLSLDSLPRFETTKPYLLTNFTNGLPTGHDAYTAVYYTVDTDGNKTYKRYDPISFSFVPYELRIVKAFTQLETKNWVEQNYVYSLHLVAGVSVLEYLTAQYAEQIEGDVPTDVQTLYDALYALNTINDELDTIDLTRPLLNYSSVQVILAPTKLTVYSNIKGGM